MKIIDPIEHIRSHPDMYLWGGSASPSDLASRLTADALLLGASRTLVVHTDQWWAVAADVDWLAGAVVSADALFGRICTFRTDYFLRGAKASLLDHFARREGDFFLTRGARGRLPNRKFDYEALTRLCTAR